MEVDNHLVIAKELGFINDSVSSEIDLDINELFAKLSKFIEKAK